MFMYLVVLGQCSGIGSYSQIQGEVCDDTNLQASYAIAIPNFSLFIIPTE